MVPPPKILFNQVFNADVTIKKNSHVEGEYKIMLKSNISPVLMNQIWINEKSPAAIALNNCRIVKRLDIIKWTKTAASNPDYTPIVTLKLDKNECPITHKDGVCRHMFVMKRSKINKHGKIVFYVSPEAIVPSNNASKYAKTLLNIPTTEKNQLFTGAEFTADPW